MKKHVYYTCYFNLSERFLTNAGRLKLSEFSEAVAKHNAEAIKSCSKIEQIEIEVSEVVQVRSRKEENGTFDRKPITRAKVVVDVEMPSFWHVRKMVMRRFPSQSVNYMPKTKYEEVVFLFFKKLGFDVYDDVYDSKLFITIQDGNYREDVFYCLRNEPIYCPKNIHEYMELTERVLPKQQIELFD